MSRNLEQFLKENKIQKLLAVFPHSDDISYVAGGLFQLLQRLNIHTKLISLSAPDKKDEFDKARKKLGIDDVLFMGIRKDRLTEDRETWKDQLTREIISADPDIVLSFAPDGVTGHPDHIAVSVAVLACLKDPKLSGIKLLWRIPDKQEYKFFISNKEEYVIYKPFYQYNLTLRESLNKLMAIFAHKSKLEKKFFKLRLIEWYLFDHKELYHDVELKKHQYSLNVKYK